jgi:glutaconate CoA-transferase subunit A
VKLNELSGVAFNVALDAGARHVPFLPMAGIGGSALPEVTPSLYAQISCPFTGTEMLAIRALTPDTAIIHTRRADAAGNAELARGARRVVITCEELVSTEEISANPAATSVPGFLVDAVIEAPWGAHPTTHVPSYGFDAWAVADYADICAAGESSGYISTLAGESEEGYRSRVLDAERRSVLSAIAAGAPKLTAA